MPKTLKLNVIKHCDNAPPVFMVINSTRSALKCIGNGIYSGTAGEIYVECSQEEIKSHFAMKMKQAFLQLRTATGLPESQDVKAFFDSAIAKIEKSGE